MKTIQKSGLFAVLFLNLLTGFSASAQVTAMPPSQKKQVFTDRAVKNYVLSLRSSNHGVVESAIFNTLNIAAQRPDANLERLEKEISKLENSGHTPSIRYKSLLARYVFSHPDLLAELSPNQFESDTEYFQALSSHLSIKLLSDPAVAVK